MTADTWSEKLREAVDNGCDPADGYAMATMLIDDLRSAERECDDIKREWNDWVQTQKEWIVERAKTLAENADLRAKLAEFEQHEKWTHDTLGAILGTDDALRVKAAQMKAKTEQAEKLLRRVLSCGLNESGGMRQEIQAGDLDSEINQFLADLRLEKGKEATP